MTKGPFACLGRPPLPNHTRHSLSTTAASYPPLRSAGYTILRFPLSDRPPRLLRAALWHYDFTHNRTSPDWWQRRRVREYLPTVNSTSLEPVLRKLRWWGLTPPPRHGPLIFLTGAVRRGETVLAPVLIIILLARWRRWLSFPTAPPSASPTRPTSPTVGDKRKAD